MTGTSSTSCLLMLIEVRSSSRGDFSTIQKKCYLYRLGPRANAGGVYCTGLKGLNIICKHRKTLEWLDTSKRSVQELEPKMSRLLGGNTVAKSFNGAVAHLQTEPADAHAQGKHDLSALQTRADTD